MKRTPFFEFIDELEPAWTSFYGWGMPVYVSSIKDEHLCVRNYAGLFDVSHMGFIKIKGSDAHDFVSRIITNEVHSVVNGKAIYSPICNEQGFIIDDIILYKKDERTFYMISNAGNFDKVSEWLHKNNDRNDDVIIENENFCGIALQGPKSREILSKFFGHMINNLGYYTFKEIEKDNSKIIVARTGYTGELGFELWIPSQDKLFIKSIWDFLMLNDVKVSGLGARDSLRIEAGYPLYGNELDENITPIESGLLWTVKFDKDEFIGKKALLEKEKVGVTKKLAGFEMLDRGIARHGCEVFRGDKKIGYVTSGTYSFFLNKSIAMGYIDTEYYKMGGEIDIIIRDKRVKANITKPRFYNNPNLRL